MERQAPLATAIPTQYLREILQLRTNRHWPVYLDELLCRTGYGIRSSISIEEWFYMMELEKEDPNGHLFPIDKDDPRWSGDFGG